MRVWVYPEKQYEELGARRLEVEVARVKAAALKRIEANPEDEVDVDADIYYERWVFPVGERAKALKKAKRVAQDKASAFGSATVIEQVVDWYVEEDRIAEWVNVGEPEYVD